MHLFYNNLSDYNDFSLEIWYNQHGDIMTKIVDAYNLISNSFLRNYYSDNAIKTQLQSVTEINDNDLFIREFGKTNMDVLEGFNRNNISYIGPLSTPHTVIHETLHNLSSSFSIDGKRLKNGIDLRVLDNNFSFLLNEGLTDYLSTKISNEPERNKDYVIGVRFFRNIDRILNVLYGNNNLLFEGYISNNNFILENFINNFSTYKYKNQVLDYNAFNKIFGYLSSKEIDGFCNNMELNALKYLKKRTLFKSNNKDIDFEMNTELYIVGLIKKAYYDTCYRNAHNEKMHYTEDQINECMQKMIFEGNLRYITNIRGTRDLLIPVIKYYDLKKIIYNNMDSLHEIGIDNIMNTKHF